MATTYMQLSLPVVGSSGTIGPTWATLLNAAITLVDEHDHTTNKGTKVPSTGLNISSDLTFNNHNATDLYSSRYTNQSASLSGANDKNCVYVSSGDLYYNNASGSAIQLTSGAGINLTSIGSIGGDYSTSTASLFYTTLTTSFTFTQDTGITASVQTGPISITENVASGKAVTLQTSTGLAANYTLTLPPALPASTLVALVAATGAVSLGQIANAQVSNSAAITYSKLSLSNSIVNADISSSAAIAYSKLNLGTSIVNADISGSAAIAYSKLNLSTSIVNADISGSAAIAYSKLSLSGSITNTDVATGAAIAYSKLNLTGSIKAADREAATVAASTNTSTFSSTSTSYVTVTDATLTFTFAGRPVLITCKSVGGGGGSFYMVGSNSGKAQLLINGSGVNEITIGSDFTPVSAMTVIYGGVAVSGTYTVTLQVKTTNAASTIYASSLILQAVEL